MTESSITKFRRSALISIAAVYLLIIAGGIVRSTGSGMGCPDWPRCFGRIIPPVDENQLPSDYKEKYKVAGREAVFNVTKTWIEYINRLLGAVTGLLVIWVFINSFALRKSDFVNFVLSGLILFLVIIEGLVGKYVVATHLKPIAITIHMYGSIIIILLLIYVVCRTYKKELTGIDWLDLKSVKRILLLVIGFTLIQIFTGTQVRQEVDEFSLLLNYEGRESWIGRLSDLFIIHRTFSWIILAIHLYLIYKLNKSGNSSIAKKITFGIGAILLMELIAGILLNYAGFPAFIQPLHLLLAIMLLSLQFFLLYIFNFKLSEKHI